MLLPLRAVWATVVRLRESHVTFLAIIWLLFWLYGDPMSPLYITPAGQPFGSIIFPGAEWKTPA